MLAALRRTAKMPLRARIDPRMLPNYSTAAINPAQDEVLFGTKGAVRTVTLNRPKKLNAINGNICELLLPRLQEYGKSDLAGSIVIKGAGGKAFSAGGDVAELAIRSRDEGLEKASETNAAFFREEFSLNHLVATYNKPYVSLWDGIVMGGGIGLSAHGSFRVGTEKTLLAMPETTIGYYPDVGGLFFLSRLNGEFGLYMALTSARIKGYDAYALGLATHFVASERVPQLEDRLSELQAGAIELEEYYRLVDSAIEDFGAEAPADYKTAYGPKQLDIIDAAFKHDSVEEIIDALRALESESPEFVRATLKTLEERCPVSLKVTLAMYRKVADIDIKAAFQEEMIVCHNFCLNPNFREGVLALLVEKRPPKWEPAQISEVTPEIVKQFFVPPPSFRPMSFVNDVTFKEYPHKFGLPSENDVMLFVVGETSEQETKATRKDVVDFFSKKYASGTKVGLEDYLNRLLDRRTTPDPEDLSLLDWKY